MPIEPLRQTQWKLSTEILCLRPLYTCQSGPSRSIAHTRLFQRAPAQTSAVILATFQNVTTVKQDTVTVCRSWSGLRLRIVSLALCVDESSATEQTDTITDTPTIGVIVWWKLSNLMNVIVSSLCCRVNKLGRDAMSTDTHTCGHHCYLWPWSAPVLCQMTIKGLLNWQAYPCNCNNHLGVRLLISN